MTDSLLWKDISLDQLKYLETVTKPEIIKEFLSSALRFGSDSDDEEGREDLPQRGDFFKGIRSIEESYDSFKKLVQIHALDRSPISVGIFSPRDVEAFNDYMMERLYEFTCAPETQLLISQRGMGMTDFAPKWDPLSEGLVQSDGTGNKEEAAE